MLARFVMLHQLLQWRYIYILDIPLSDGEVSKDGDEGQWKITLFSCFHGFFPQLFMTSVQLGIQNDT